MALERLQKIIAAAGIASRRKAEELIESGLVSVNGKIVTELGTKADPDADSIRVNNKLLKGRERQEYIALNKPRGYVTTVSDPEGRPTVMELVRSNARLYPIGRLDFNSEGLLLLTNDGDLAHKLMKAASHIPKTYLVKVAGLPAEAQLQQLRAGVSIAEERDPKRRVRTAPAQIRVIKAADNPWLEVILHEGRNRQIRKMFEEIGHHVEKIRRVRYGPLELDLPPGESRPLTLQEIRKLKHATEPDAQRFRSKREQSVIDADQERSGRRFERGEREQRISPESRRQPPARFAEQRREFRGGQRERWSRDRKPSRQRGERDRSRFRDSRPNRWQSEIQGKKQGESAADAADVRSHGRKHPLHSRGWGAQNRGRQGRHEQPPGSPDHSIDPELFRDARHERKRRNRDRRS
ncbi:MAG TPA: pseudouridine synthase [Terriglobales bacterium]|nr:pseudouridine synthase [Terriglobales bacterium]